MYTSNRSYFTENMPKPDEISDATEHMRLYEIFIAAGLAGSHKNIAEIAALGGIGDDEPVVRTYRTIELRFDPESQSMRRVGDIVAGGRATDKKTLVIQL